MKVTRINDEQLVITLPTNRESFTIGRLGGLPRITFESKDDLNDFWDLLLENADELGATTGPKTAELELLSNRIDALENNDQCNDTAQKHLRELIRNLDNDLTRHKAHTDHLDEAEVHDLIAQYIIDDSAGTLRRKIVEVVIDRLMNR